MKKSAIYGVLSVLILIFLTSMTSAEILISQTDSKYNFGDNFDVKIEVKRATETNDFLRVNLVCDSDSVELYKGPLRVQAGKTENITIKAQLDRSLISDTEGSCNIRAEYSDESSQGSSFEISDKIDLIVSLSSSNFNPGDQVYVSGSAKKKNGEKINGFLQISLSSSNVSFLANQINDNFNYSFFIPENQPADLYNLEVKVYEREVSGEVANEGVYSEVIKVNQVIKSGDISISSPSLKPQENLSYVITLRDQSGKEVKANVNAIIYNSNEKDNIFLRKNVLSGDISYISLPKNATPGRWEIEGIYGSIPLSRYFDVESVSKASFHIKDGNLVVVNEGNIPYQGTIKLFLGDEDPMSEELYVENQKEFAINGPEGEYDLSITDDQGNDFNLGNISILDSAPLGLGFLTGSAIGLRDPNSSGTSYFRLAFWIILILVLSYAAVYYYRRVKKDVFYGKKPQKLSNTSLAFKTIPKKYISEDGDHVELKKVEPEPKRAYGEVSKQERIVPESKIMFDTYSGSDTGSSSNDYEAKREEVVVLALKIKNGQKLRASESSAFNAIRNALHKAKMSKAKVYDQGDTNLVVFSQTLSEKANAVEAVRVAHQIDLTLKDFNKKYAVKIEYGLGMHVGEMFFEMIDGKAKFTSIGNITILPKNLASNANASVLLSPELYKKVYSVIKSEQTQSGAYILISFKDRSSHSQFIDRFMNKSESAQPVRPHSSHPHTSHAPHRTTHHSTRPLPPSPPKHSHSRFASEHNVIPHTTPGMKPKDSGLHPPKKSTFQRY